MNGADYSVPDNESLALAAQNGDTRAMSELTARISPHIRSKAASFGLSAQDTQDLFQEGMLGFLGAVFSFKEDKGASFRTYAVVCASNSMISNLRVRSKRGNIPQDAFVPMDWDLPVEDGAPGPEERLIAGEQAESIISAINNELSDFERKVVLLFIGGGSYEEIAASLDSDTKAVDNAIQRVRKKLRSFTN